MALKRDPVVVVPDAPARGRSYPPPPPPTPPRVFLPNPGLDRRDQGGGSIFDLLVTKRQFDRYKKSKVVAPLPARPVIVEKEETVSHIFGIPHSVGEIVTGIVDWGKDRLFGLGAPPSPVVSQPNFYTGFSPFDSAPELISEGFSEAYKFSQDLNVGGVPVTNGVQQTFLGCPVEENEGCQPAKKRYTITIDEATGQCIKIKRTKSRKRRRRLAAVSDIKDIAALKTVFGSGKGGAENLQVWIATRGR